MSPVLLLSAYFSVFLLTLLPPITFFVVISLLSHCFATWCFESSLVCPPKALKWFGKMFYTLVISSLINLNFTRTAKICNTSFYHALQFFSQLLFVLGGFVFKLEPSWYWILNHRILIQVFGDLKGKHFNRLANIFFFFCVASRKASECPLVVKL